jgi:hypothetical protein
VNTSFLARRSISVSISDSPDLALLGLSERHLRDAMVEIARFFLAAGASLTYGGDLRAHGFTELLFELVASYHRHLEERRSAITNFLAWPVHMQLPREELDRRRQDLGESGTIVCLDLGGAVIPFDDVLKLQTVEPSSREWATGLTAMRRTLIQETDSHVLLGGQVKGYRGSMPGVAEEALLALNAHRPVFLIGGFGGCARDIAETIGIRRFPAVSRTTEWPHRDDFVGRHADELSNGLNLQEAERLASTPHSDEIVTLILRGLHRI